MNKSNRVKLIIAGLLIIVVAIATISYGNSQRKKVAGNDPTTSSLPTIEETQKQSNNNPSKPGESQPNAQQTPQTQNSAPNTPQQSVQPQVPQGRTPATGPEDHILPIVVLGSLSGLYLAGHKRMKLAKVFDK